MLTAMSSMLIWQPRCGVHRFSRSTATFEDKLFGEGSDARRKRLDSELRALGVDPSQLDWDTRLDGSAALRAYRSFVWPKSENALAMASQPSRSRTIAAQIAYSVRESVATHTEWLQNRDVTRLTQRTPLPLDIVLDGLRSGENVGSIMRTVETAGARSIFACGTTPMPPVPAVQKAACNAVVDISKEPCALDVVRELRNAGTIVWALETTRHSVSLYDTYAPTDKPLALVFGNELVGISPDVIEEADAVVRIPTFGTKNSLNVAAAAAVVIYEIVRRWGEAHPRRSHG